jgi:hypothetical protein
MLLTACGASGVDVARGTLTTAALATVQADKAFADAYQIASTEARADSDDWEARDATMGAWDDAADRVETIIDGLYSGFLAAEVALDSYAKTDAVEHWTDAIGCLAEQLRELEKVLREREVNAPAPLAKVLSATEGLECP